MRTPRIATVAAVAAVAAIALAGCATSADAGSGDGGSAAVGHADQFPVTIEHAFGETTIEALPERVVTVSWANQEAALALGVVPVAMPAVTWGDDDGDGVLPWVEDALSELGAETPELMDETEGFDYEAISDAQPDVILAAYSGMTEEEYDTLSKIAPVVAHPDMAWGTTWQQLTTINGTALGLKDEADQLVTDLEAHIGEVAAEYPAIEGKTAMFSSFDATDLGTLGFYTTHDPRALLLGELGFAVPGQVEESSSSSDEFWSTFSTEEIERFEDLDVLVTYGDDSTVSTMQGDALLTRIPAVSDAAIALLPGSSPLSSVANPSPLSIDTDLFAEFVALVGDAAAQAK
jgi:iron complex transport system substrate-binding protein